MKATTFKEVLFKVSLLGSIFSSGLSVSYGMDVPEPTKAITHVQKKRTDLDEGYYTLSNNTFAEEENLAYSKKNQVEVVTDSSYEDGKTVFHIAFPEDANGCCTIRRHDGGYLSYNNQHYGGVFTDARCSPNGNWRDDVLWHPEAAKNGFTLRNHRFPNAYLACTNEGSPQGHWVKILTDPMPDSKIVWRASLAEDHLSPVYFGVPKAGQFDALKTMLSFVDKKDRSSIGNVSQLWRSTITKIIKEEKEKKAKGKWKLEGQDLVQWVGFNQWRDDLFKMQTPWSKLLWQACSSPKLKELDLSGHNIGLKYPQAASEIPPPGDNLVIILKLELHK